MTKKQLEKEMTYLKSAILAKFYDAKGHLKTNYDEYGKVESTEYFLSQDAIEPIIRALLDDREELVNALGRVQDYLAFDLHSAPLKLSDALTASEERMKRLGKGK